MAEFVMKDLVKKAHLEDKFEIASAATSTEEIWGGRGDPDGKILLLLDHCGRTGQEVADPWYTDDFAATWDDVLQGCTALLGILTGKK